MVITDRLVYIHQPKTGGTFVTAVLFRLHNYRWTLFQHAKLAAFKHVVGGNRHGTVTVLNKHGTCSDVPAEHRGKILVATTRNPFDLYVSEYRFGWWRRRELRQHYGAIPRFEKRFPTFPDLSFGDFIDLTQAAFCKVRNPDGSPRYGYATEVFARFYFRDGLEALAQLSESDIESRRWEANIFAVRFIRQERLNEELHDFLVSLGYPRADVAFVKTRKRVLPQGHRRARDDRWESYYTPDLVARVRRNDRLIFGAFPDYDT